MIICKMDILAKLKEFGYSSTRLRKEKVFGGLTLQKFRDGGIPSKNELDKICEITGLQPGDILEYRKV